MERSSEELSKDFHIFQDGIDRSFRDIRRERLRQNFKFTEYQYGSQSHDIFKWLAILGEEIGEANKAALDHDFGKDTIEHLREELVQTAAVAVAIIQRIDASQGELFKETT
jgi:hypothetical protein